jgi:hypothetical protein
MRREVVQHWPRANPSLSTNCRECRSQVISTDEPLDVGRYYPTSIMYLAAWVFEALKISRVLKPRTLEPKFLLPLE